MGVQKLEQGLKFGEGKQIIIPSSMVKERFDVTFTELVLDQQFLKNIVEIGRIVANFGKAPIRPEEDEERGYSDTDSLFKRELAIPANADTTLQAEIKLFRDIHESKIIIQQVIPSRERYDFPTYPKITLTYHNNGNVSLAVNPKDVEGANDFETPIDIKLANYPRKVDPRDIYRVQNIEGDSLEISGPPYSFGSETVEFVNKFTAEALGTFKKLESKTAADAKNHSNIPFTIYPN